MSILRMILRGWPVLVLGVSLTALATLYVGGQVSPAYSARGSVIVLAPASESGQSGYAPNPYASTGVVQVVTSALYGIMQSPQFAASVDEAGASGTFVTQIQPSGVVVEVIATDSTPSSAVKTLNVTIERMSEQLKTIQERSGAPQDTLMRTDVLLADTKATQQNGSRARAQLITISIGLLWTFIAIVLFESLKQRVRLQRTSRGQGRGASEPPWGIWRTMNGARSASHPDDNLTQPKASAEEVSRQ